MLKPLQTIIICCCWLSLSACQSTSTDQSYQVAETNIEPAQIPDELLDSNYLSKYELDYSGINKLYRLSVIYLGKSERNVLGLTRANLGTRMKNQHKRRTAFEANRFYYSVYESENNRAVLLDVKKNLESLHSVVPLNELKQKEQLAYWLNLYNVSMLYEIASAYPVKNLAKFYKNSPSILDKKVVNIAGVDLSFNDIQHEILDVKFENDPLIMYGLYKGYIGGPSIRVKAYTGKNIWEELQNNADEFINSNRGSDGKSKKIKISTLYAQNSQYFPDFQQDVKKHLLKYIDRDFKYRLKDSDNLVADIEDYNIAD